VYMPYLRSFSYYLTMIVLEFSLAN